MACSRSFPVTPGSHVFKARDYAYKKERRMGEGKKVSIFPQPSGRQVGRQYSLSLADGTLSTLTMIPHRPEPPADDPGQGALSRPLSSLRLFPGTRAEDSALQPLPGLSVRQGFREVLGGTTVSFTCLLGSFPGTSQGLT